jgi:uncharacterized iron-regulated membrane protein
MGGHMIRRLVGQIHLWLGLALCVPVVMIGLTGSLLVFQDELRGLFAPRAQPGEPRTVGEIVAAARAAAPAGFVPSSYAAPQAPGLLAMVRLSPAGRTTGAGEGARVDVDPVSLATYPNPSDDFVRQILFLHSTLLTKAREGREIVGWLGVAMLVMALSGLVNWWPRRGAWRAAFSVSPSATGYRLWREVHGAAGIWGLVVLATVSFAGIYLVFPDAVRSVVDLLLPARDLRAAMAAVKVQPIKDADPLGIDDAIALARAEVAGGRLTVAFLPTKPDQPYRIALLRADQERHEMPVTVLIDPWARRVAATFDPRQFSSAERWLGALHAVHSGEGLGPVWKGLVFVTGFLPALFAATGIAMWLKRRRPTATVVPLINQSEAARRAGE